MGYTKSDEVSATNNRSLLNKPIVHILLIAIVGLFAYSNTFHVPFHFDDRPLIAENHIMKDLSFFFGPSNTNGFSFYNQNRYIAYLTFALNYYFHGLDVIGYHIFNIAVHIINAFLIYWLVILTFKTPLMGQTPNQYELSTGLIALFSAVFFVSHPVQTEAVTYIWQRVTSLATMFYLLSLASYVKSRLLTIGIKRLLLYGISFISAVLAMKTKEIAFTLPIVITLYEFMFLEGKVKKRILYLIPLLLTMLIIPLTLIDADKPTGDLIGDVSEATRVQTTIPRLDYLFTQFRVIVTYIRLLFLPINQNLDYDFPVYHTFSDPNVFLSFLFLLSLSSLGILLLYRSRIARHDVGSHNTHYSLHATRLVAFGIFWFFITLSVESSVIPIVDVIFEHRMYIPSVGAIIAFNSTTFHFTSRLGVTRHALRITRYVIPVLLSTIVITLSIATYARNSVWQTEISLWEDVVKKSPSKARGYYNLGNVYLERKEYVKAIGELSKAISYDRYYLRAYNNLGVLYKEIGQFNNALPLFEKVVSIDNNNEKAHEMLALIYSDIGQEDKSIAHFQAVAKINPSVKNYYNLGLALHNKGELNTAIVQYKEALKLNPNHFDAYLNLANAYSALGEKSDALLNYKRALEINPDDAYLHYNMGLFYEKTGEISRAIDEYKKSFELDSNLKVAFDHIKALEKDIGNINSGNAR